MQISFSEVNQWGKFDVIIKGFGEIKGCQYKAGKSAKGDYEFISFPQRKKLDKDGQPVKDPKTGKDKYISDLYLEKSFTDKILAAYREQMLVNDEDEDFDQEEIPF